MPAANGDSAFVEKCRRVVGVNPVEDKAEKRTAFFRISQNMQTGNFGKPFLCIPQNFLLVGANRFDADLVYPIDRCAESDDFRNGRRSRFETVRRRSECRLFECDVVDHLAAALHRAHLFEKFVFAVENADARGAVHLVPGKGEKVAVERLNIDFDVRSALGRVDENLDFRVDPSNGTDDFLYRVFGSYRIADVRDRDNFCLAGNDEVGNFFEEQIPVVGDWDDLEFGLADVSDELPRDDVRVMFERADENFIAGF